MDFLIRRRKRLTQLTILLAVLACAAPTLSDVLGGSVPLSVWAMAVILAGMAFNYFQEARKSKLTDREIAEAVSETTGPR